MHFSMGCMLCMVCFVLSLILHVERSGTLVRYGMCSTMHTRGHKRADADYIAPSYTVPLYGTSQCMWHSQWPFFIWPGGCTCTKRGTDWLSTSINQSICLFDLLISRFLLMPWLKIHTSYSQVIPPCNGSRTNLNQSLSWLADWLIDWLRFDLVP